VLVVGTLAVGLLLPLALHLLPGLGRGVRATLAAVLVLAGGFLMRYGVVNTPPALLALGSDALAVNWDEPLWSFWQGQALLVGTIVLGAVLAVALHLRGRRTVASALLTGGAAVLTCAAVTHFTFESVRPGWGRPRGSWLVLSPEDGRERGGGAGASLLDPDDVTPRSKLREQ
jgi:hypothetical protein